MKRIFQVVVVVLVVAFCFGQMALAEGPHITPKVTPKVIHNPGLNANAVHSNALAAGFHGLWQALAGSPADYYPTPTNSDGYPIWPCFGGGSSTNPDCPQIGDPAQANYGMEVGVPFFTWPLSLCENADTATIPCGQTETWYEDDSGDSTDYLAYGLYAKQGTSYVANEGLYVYAPNPGSGFVTVWSGDNYMGTGACISGYASTGYPIPAVQSGSAACTSKTTCTPAYTEGFVVPPTGAAATCVNPVATTGTTNEVAFQSVTELLVVTSSSFKWVHSATTCAGTGGDYCYTFTPKAKGAATTATQKWNVALE